MLVSASYFVRFSLNGILIVFLSLIFSFKGYSQQMVTCLSTNCFIDNLPTEIFGSVDVGFAYKHFYGTIVFSNKMGTRASSFQLLGLEGRVYFREVGKMINGYVGFQGGTQVSGRRTGSPMYDNYVPCGDTQNIYYNNDTFYRANFQESLNVGLSFCYKNIELNGGIGRSYRRWSSSKQGSDVAWDSEFTKGMNISIGLNYYFNFKKTKK